MAEEEDLYKGPLSERIFHKNWKVRRAACEELAQKFKEATDNNIFEEYGQFEYVYSSNFFLYSLVPAFSKQAPNLKRLLKIRMLQPKKRGWMHCWAGLTGQRTPQGKLWTSLCTSH